MFEIIKFILMLFLWPFYLIYLVMTTDQRSTFFPKPEPPKPKATPIPKKRAVVIEELHAARFRVVNIPKKKNNR